MSKNRKIKFYSENLAALIMLGFLFLVPVLLGAYQTNSYTYYLTCILLSFSVTLVWGVTGIFSFGQAAFLGIGGYAYGIIARLLEGSFSTPVAAVLAILISAAAAGCVGYFMFYGGYQ